MQPSSDLIARVSASSESIREQVAYNCSGNRAGCNCLARDTRATTGEATVSASGYGIARIVVAEESGRLCDRFEMQS